MARPARRSITGGECYQAPASRRELQPLPRPGRGIDHLESCVASTDVSSLPKGGMATPTRHVRAVRIADHDIQAAVTVDPAAARRGMSVTLGDDGLRHGGDRVPAQRGGCAERGSHVDADAARAVGESLGQAGIAVGADDGELFGLVGGLHTTSASSPKKS